jgi:mycothiol synthase
VTTVRPATSADADDIGRVQVETWRAAYADILPQETIDAFDIGVRQDMWREGLGRTPRPGSATFVALAGDEIVGYSGLVRLDDATAEDGLTVVRRDWRRRGLATALKRAEIAWAAANGVRELVTWTQRGNDGMRAVNEQLGYAYRSVSITVHAPLPLPRP